MTQYNVMGMSCAACVARVEKAVSKIDGVNSCSVSLLTNSMNVDGSADPFLCNRNRNHAGTFGNSWGCADRTDCRSRSGSAYRKEKDSKRTIDAGHL